MNAHRRNPESALIDKEREAAWRRQIGREAAPCPHTALFDAALDNLKLHRGEEFARDLMRRRARFTNTNRQAANKLFKEAAE